MNPLFSTGFHHFNIRINLFQVRIHHFHTQFNTSEHTNFECVVHAISSLVGTHFAHFLFLEAIQLLYNLVAEFGKIWSERKGERRGMKRTRWKVFCSWLKEEEGIEGFTSVRTSSFGYERGWLKSHNQWHRLPGWIPSVKKRAESEWSKNCSCSRKTPESKQKDLK